MANDGWKGVHELARRHASAKQNEAEESKRRQRATYDEIKKVAQTLEPHFRPRCEIFYGEALGVKRHLFWGMFLKKLEDDGKTSPWTISFWDRGKKERGESPKIISLYAWADKADVWFHYFEGAHIVRFIKHEQWIIDPNNNSLYFEDFRSWFGSDIIPLSNFMLAWAPGLPIYPKPSWVSWDPLVKWSKYRLF